MLKIDEVCFKLVSVALLSHFVTEMFMCQPILCQSRLLRMVKFDVKTI